MCEYFTFLRSGNKILITTFALKRLDEVRVMRLLSGVLHVFAKPSTLFSSSQFTLRDMASIFKVGQLYVSFPRTLRNGWRLTMKLHVIFAFDDETLRFVISTVTRNAVTKYYRRYSDAMKFLEF